MVDLKAGDYVILNDCDAPQTRMVARLTSFDRASKFWRAVYLYTKRNRIECMATDPTPLRKFGKSIEWQGSKYRVVDTGAACVATYRDGVPRKWQDSGGPFWVDSSERDEAAPAQEGDGE